MHHWYSDWAPFKTLIACQLLIILNNVSIVLLKFFLNIYAFNVCCGPMQALPNLFTMSHARKKLHCEEQNFLIALQNVHLLQLNLSSLLLLSAKLHIEYWAYLTITLLA